MSKYYWSREEEARLRELWKSGVTNVEVLARELGRTPGAVEKKLERLSSSLKVQTTTRSVSLEKPLFTHEQVLKILAEAMNSLMEPGKDRLELHRLRLLVEAAKTYDSVLEKFEKWSEFEARLLETTKKIEELPKAKDAA